MAEPRPELVYISRRLTREIVQEHLAYAPFLDITLDVPKAAQQLAAAAGLGDVPLNITERHLGDNPFMWAAAATTVVAPNTGTLAERADFVTMTLELDHRLLRVWFGINTEDGIPSEEHRIAGFHGETDVAGVGRAVIALFGSVQNLRGWVGETPIPAGHRMPSDPNGLFAILRASFEPGDPSVSDWYLEREQRFGPLHRSLDALNYWESARADEYPPARFDALIKVFDWIEDIDLVQSRSGSWDVVSDVTDADLSYFAYNAPVLPGSEPVRQQRFARIVIGTPLWLRTARLPAADQHDEEVAALPAVEERKPRWWRRGASST